MKKYIFVLLMFSMFLLGGKLVFASGPIVTSLSPSSGPVGTTITINGSGFTIVTDAYYNSISFVGSTSPTSPYISPVNGEYHWGNVPSSNNGTTLSFIVPAEFKNIPSPESINQNITYTSVIPGTYYIVVETADGKSIAKPFTVTSLILNSNNNIATSTTTRIYNFGTTTLKNGSRGEAVKELQRFLNANLNLGLVVDGILGPKTIAVIKTWQANNGLVADGFVGRNTKAKMNELANTPKSSFLYSNGEGIPNLFYIPWRTVEADFASPTSNGGYICKSNGLNAQVTVLINSPAASCSGVGCGGTYTRSAIVCGNKYVIHDASISGFPYWGYFDME